jgi:hypothetical protein
MSVADRVSAMMGNQSPGDIERMRPADRERFAGLCKAVLAIIQVVEAKRDQGEPPKSGNPGAARSRGARP